MFARTDSFTISRSSRYCAWSTRRRSAFPQVGREGPATLMGGGGRGAGRGRRERFEVVFRGARLEVLFCGWTLQIVS